MRTIIVYYAQGGGVTVPAGAKFLIKSAKWVKVIEAYFGLYKGSDKPSTFGTLPRNSTIYSASNGILIRSLDSVAGTLDLSICYAILKGDFETDTLEISTDGLDTPYPSRIEIRNEYGVLITDNGKPWPGGTYPPDAKNRSNLSGLQASPAAINPELETALMGDETNNERVEE